MRRWENLPEFMRTEEVRPYYNVLAKRWISLGIIRIFDFLMSTLMLVFLSPIFLILAVWIKIDSKGTVFYRQERVTQYGKKFKIYKFRTMVQNADKTGSTVTVCRDSRITKVGNKLRGCRLDELPQLINIWKGEMSFVGTRPEVPKYVRRYTREMYATLLLPAGVTSEASIRFKDEDVMLGNSKNIDKIYLQVVLPQKMEYNMKEIKKYGFISNMMTCLKTIFVSFRR